MLTESSLAAIAERGVRVISDYLPPSVSRSARYERILELERKLGKRPSLPLLPATRIAWHIMSG